MKRKMKVLVYKITIPWLYGYGDVRDMFRYSEARPSKVESWIRGKPKTVVMRQLLRHGARSRKFFYAQIKKRWESFGCEVEIVGEEKADPGDKAYRYDIQETEELVKRLVYFTGESFVSIFELYRLSEITKKDLNNIEFG